jgi:hypothetical protein
VNDERDRAFWLLLRRALQMIITAIDKRWGHTDREDIPRDK